MYIDPALTPYIEEAQQFNSQPGDLLRPAVDTPEAIAAERRRMEEIPGQQLTGTPAAPPPPGEERVLPGGTSVRVIRPEQFTAVYLHLHGAAGLSGCAPQCRGGGTSEL